MSLTELVERYGVEPEAGMDWKPRYNVAPTLQIGVVVELSGGLKKLMFVKWGLVPPWAKDNKYQPIINLRSETVLTKPGFKRVLESARCLVPVDGFNEWKTVDKKKYPFRFVMKTGEIFSLGGVFQTLVPPNGKTLHTVSLITTEANALVGEVHDRMPVIIPRTHESAWLNPKSKLPDFAMCLSPYPDQDMRSYQVSTKINSGKIDSPDLIVPV
jgi:putative SOS response-associated peptidase YedK